MDFWIKSVYMNSRGVTGSAERAMSGNGAIQAGWAFEDECRKEGIRLLSYKCHRFDAETGTIDPSALLVVDLAERRRSIEGRTNRPAWTAPTPPKTSQTVTHDWSLIGSLVKPPEFLEIKFK